MNIATIPREITEPAPSSPAPTAHVLLFYSAMTEVYTDAAAIGLPVAAIAEFYLERWWTLFAAEPLECETRLEYA